MLSFKNSPKMKKNLIAAFCVVAFLCLYTVVFQWYFNPSRLKEKTQLQLAQESLANPQEAERDRITRAVAALGDDNGAKYYLMACLALVNPEHDPLRDLDNVPILEDFLNKNQPALDLVREGIEKKTCLFPSDDRPPILPFRQIVRLIAAKAMLFARKKDYESAANLYVDGLRFAKDVSNECIITNMTAAALEGIEYDAMRSYVRDLPDETVCGRFLNQLIEIDEAHASLHDLLEREFAFYKQLLKKNSAEFLYYRKKPVENFNFPDQFLDAMTKTIGYGWFRIQASIMLRNMDKINRNLLEESKKPYPEIVSSHQEDKIPKDKLSRAMVPVIYKFMSAYVRSEVRRRANIIMVALRLYYLEHSKYPETLEELAPVVPEKILTDPFSIKRFAYKTTSGGYLFYSFGPDLRDDGGKETSSGEKGDIVLSSANSKK